MNWRATSATQDSRHIEAAEDWLGLGNCQEANEEPKRIPHKCMVIRMCYVSCGTFTRRLRNGNGPLKLHEPSLNGIRDPLISCQNGLGVVHYLRATPP